MGVARRPSGPQPTLTTVAERAGVSRQTVSNALNNPALLREDTLARVLAVIDELGYTPNRAARALRTRASRLIGLRVAPVQEGASSALMDRFVHTLVEATARTGHHVLLFTGDPEDPLDGYEDLIRETAADGFVLTDTYDGTPRADLLRRVGAPFVAFGRPWEDADDAYPWVDVDGARGAELAVLHLLDRGYARIAWLGWEESSRIGEDRRAGWTRALEQRGAEAGPDQRTSDSLGAGRIAMHHLLDAGADAVACASDTLALGAFHALAERGLWPGRDIGVVGFDDSPGAQVTWPGLTSVRQPLEQVALEVVDELQSLLAGRPPDEPARMLEPSLVVRGSSQR